LSFISVWFFVVSTSDKARLFEIFSELFRLRSDESDDAGDRYFLALDCLVSKNGVYGSMFATVLPEPFAASLVAQLLASA